MTEAGREDVPEHKSALAIAERHVRECEARVADQVQFIRELYADGYPEAAARARKVLALFEDMLHGARKQLESERRRLSAQGE